MHNGLVWLWGWFIVGAWAHMFKRAYLKVTGPDHSVTTYTEYFDYFWPLLLFRAICGAALYGLTFYPDTFANVVRLMGWSSLGTIPSLFPHIWVVALVAGLSVDSLLDFISTKIPFLGGFIPPFTLVSPTGNGGTAVH
jgi:hypothetical protein